MGYLESISAPRDLRGFKLDKRKLVQMWSYDKEIRVQLFQERSQRGPSGGRRRLARS